MSRRETITPTEGHLVRDERGNPVTEPTEVRWNTFWARLERQGSITRGRPKSGSKKTTKKDEG